MIDIVIVGLYLVLSLLIGIYMGKDSKSMEDYAIASRNYPTSVLIATITATWIGAPSTMGLSEKVITGGPIFILIFMSSAFAKMIIGQFVAPRMGQFSGLISAGDVMGKMYGNYGKIITGVCGTIACIGILGAQVTAMGYLFNYFLKVSHTMGILIGAGIVVIYSSFGGIRAVTATDVLQFFIIIIIIPIVSNVALSHIGGYKALYSCLPESHLNLIVGEFSFNKYFSLFILFMMPSMQPHYIQRLLMAHDVKQIKQSMYIASFIDIIFYKFVGIIGLVALIIVPNINPNVSLLHLINDVLPIGIKGLAIAGMLAVIMSTADSILNATGVTFVHDVIRPLSSRLSDKAELRIAKMLTFIIGSLAIIVAINFNNIVEIWIASYIFWSPAIVVPFFLGIFGIKKSSKAFISGAITGIIISFIWMHFNLIKYTNFDPVLPGIAANAIVFLLYDFFAKRVKPILAQS